MDEQQHEAVVEEDKPLEGQQAAELKPETPGTYDGELSPGGEWIWQGTGTPDDKWVANPSVGQQAEVTPRVAPTPGTAIASSATIDSLFTLVYGTRSADLSATPTYSWATGNSIIGQWPSVVSGGIINNSCIVCRFEARQMAPSTISQ